MLSRFLILFNLHLNFRMIKKNPYYHTAVRKCTRDGLMKERSPLSCFFCTNSSQFCE